MTQEDNPKGSIGLSPAQVAGSALAAVSAAVLASFAGTTGTIIGAAVGSVVATVGAATYTWSLRRTSDVVRRTAAQVRQTQLLTGTLPRPNLGPLRKGETAKEAAAEQAAVDDERAGAEAGRQFPWVGAVLAGVALAVVVLGGFTVVEAITGKPVASLVGGSDETGTTLGHLVGKGSSTEKNPTPPASTPSEGATPGGPSTDGAEPSTGTSPSAEPTQAPGGQPSEPVAPGASTAP